ncbi:MAG TPA: alpha-galactosidase [Candidatus Lokiarchaeia archaeon]|nr:alpha-galactosidase [Candidatus Lokiarchaeia archaeon]
MMQRLFENDYFAIDIDLDAGTLDLAEKEAEVLHAFLKNCAWGYKLSDRSTATLSTDDIHVRSCVVKVYEDNIGKGKLVEITCTGAPSGIDMILKLALYDDRRTFLLELVLFNTSDDDVHVVEVYPVITSAKNGSGLFFMKEPEKVRILEAGLGGALDLNVRCVFANEESDSNGNVLVHDLSTKRSFLCGVLERPAAMIEIQANEDVSVGILDEASGRTSFGDWKIKKSIVPFKCVHPAGVLTSHKMYFDLDPAKTPHEMLESYAENLARYIGILPWPRDRAVPHGWNSWGNPTKTDPKDENGKNSVVYVHDITEDRVMANFNLVLEKLVKFGLEYFQIDDGHQPHIGDWEADPEKFPNGLKPVFDAIHARGIKTGLWINPFEISLSSNLYAMHPEWALDWESSFPMKSQTLRPLDVSRPEVQRWMRSVFSRFVRYYGVEWIKTDFTYNLIGGKGFQDPDMTGIEAMQEGFKIIRDAVGPNTFVAGIGGPCLFHYGLVNTERITLDMNAAWGKDGLLMPSEQGIKPNARVISRRYYLHNRIWFTHACAIQFREPLKRNEILVQASVIGLSGSVFKVAETWLNLKDEDFAILSKMLPVYRPKGRGMRPVDIMTKEYPECWDLLVDDARNGLGEYHVVGLFNWGENQELGQPLPEETREITVNFTDVGLDSTKTYLAFEFWTGKFEGEFAGSYSAELLPRNVELLVFREKTGFPQFLSSTRHLTQGAVDVLSCKWEDPARQLVISAKAIPDHEHGFDFYIPNSYTLAGATINDGNVPSRLDDDGHLIITFENDNAAVLGIVLSFD